MRAVKPSAKGEIKKQRVITEKPTRKIKWNPKTCPTNPKEGRNKKEALKNR